MDPPANVISTGGEVTSESDTFGLHVKKKSIRIQMWYRLDHLTSNLASLTAPRTFIFACVSFSFLFLGVLACAISPTHSTKMGKSIL